jgi:hypothetical protein
MIELQLAPPALSGVGGLSHLFAAAAVFMG